jgi:hypothetical protein
LLRNRKNILNYLSIIRSEIVKLDTLATLKDVVDKERALSHNAMVASILAFHLVRVFRPLSSSTPMSRLPLMAEMAQPSKSVLAASNHVCMRTSLDLRPMVI